MSSVLAEIAGKIFTLLGYDGTDFRNVHVDAAGDLQVDVLTTAMDVLAATAANQATMITALELIDDLRNVLNSVATDNLHVMAGLRGATWSAIAVDVGGRVQADIIDSSLPSGAATEDTLSGINDLLALIALLRNALQSVATDTLRVWITPDPSVPTVYNITMTNADTEYDFPLLLDTRSFSIRCRGAHDIKLAFTEGASGTTYVTVPSGCTYKDEGLRATLLRLYFQCAMAGQVAEIVAWA